jgi:hypothetical protein
MTKSRKIFRTESNLKKVENFMRMGCSTTEIAKFMKMNYNQAWYLRKEVTNMNQKKALNSKTVDKIISTPPVVKARVSKLRKVNVNPEAVKVQNDGRNITITINLAI